MEELYFALKALNSHALLEWKAMKPAQWTPDAAHKPLAWVTQRTCYLEGFD
uniref:Uncharacterized protein n=1 Tax=Utricularia reniformis TaxID=192314 RepID=A0A1Y0B240_9LAMI|nr:hypothetical protein AEK19_MT1244 [Utricularia reniformis]ART31454.1 hypothetical protein AEK19_MT1244 [Utricularia reniformis]